MRPKSASPWQQAPFLRIAIAFFSGILIESEFAISLSAVVLCAGLSAAAVISISIWPDRLQYRLHAFRGFLLLCMTTAMGAAIFYDNDIRNRKDWIGLNDQDTVLLVFTLSEDALRRKNSFKAEAAVEAALKHEKPEKASGNLLLYFSSDTDPRLLRYGSRITAVARLQRIQNPGNPGEFDYAAYAGGKNIYHRIFVKAGEIIDVRADTTFGFSLFIRDCRTYVLSVFRKYLSRDSRAAALTEALVIGYKNDLDRDMLRDYSRTGVVHVIAISGMHLGLLYVLIQWLWKISGLYRKKIPAALLSISLLWMFSLLTGASPSVLRSAIMFSFIIAGSLINREGTVLNSLAASSFFLTCFDPFLLWNTGFQLSHLAVLGLITVQQPLSALVRIKNRPMRKVWELLAASTAAQLFTLPFCLYYFHQFPNYFLIGNLLIIPLATLILFGGLLLIFLSPVPILAVPAGRILEALSGLMNAVTSATGNLPGAVSDHIYFGRIQLVILFISIFFFSSWLKHRQFSSLLFTLLVLNVFFAMDTAESIIRWKRRELVVYNIKGHAAADIILGNKYVFCGDSALTHDIRLQDSLISPYRSYLKLDTCIGSADLSVHPVVSLPNFRLLSSHGNFLVGQGVDVLLVSGKSGVSAEGLKALNPRLTVFDGSCPLWKIDQIMRCADSLHLSYHSVSRSGAYRAKLPADSVGL